MSWSQQFPFEYAPSFGGPDVIGHDQGALVDAFLTAFYSGDSRSGQ
jgi:hypothetical protein